MAYKLILLGCNINPKIQLKVPDTQIYPFLNLSENNNL